MSDPKPIKAAVRNCFALGVGALLTGCLVGYLYPTALILTIALLGLGITLFIASIVLQRRRVKEPAVASATSQPARPLPIASGTVPVASPAAPLPPGTADRRPEMPLTVVASPAPSDRAAPSPPVKALAQEPLLDVPTLMRVPLSDLLLAAMCKDPQGARRIFAQVALQDISSEPSDNPVPATVHP
jgi:hypothetical protein